MTAVDFVKRVIAALERIRLPYMLMGSFSTNVYGKPRSTKDADFVVELGSRSISELVTALGPEFELDAQMSFETITATSRYRFHHHTTAFLVEVFMLRDDPHNRRRFARRVRGELDGQSIYVPTAEDVVIQKLRWSKHGKRQKDVDDALGVMEVQAGRLDLDYIRPWCDQHGTRSLFERLLVESRRFEPEQP